MAVDVANLSIVNYPDPILTRTADPVNAVTDEVRDVAARMIQLMLDAPGIGLAAPQVGLPWRLFVAHVPPSESLPPDTQPDTASDPDVHTHTDEPRVYINPTLHLHPGDLEPYDEGCLSLPDITGRVFRPPSATITATDLHGNQFTHTATGLLARCWQHENDHLDGILILSRMDHISKLKTKKAVKALQRQA